jgi:hypothetical protein
MTRSTSSLLWVAASLGALTGCQTPSSRVKTRNLAPPPAAAPAPVDPSFDWHVLVIAPFGSVLKDVPAALHEVLLFRDKDPDAVAADDGECYSADTPPPQFLGRTADGYMLCFKQDRLSRIHATVGLREADAPAVFATACAGWLKSAGAPTADAIDAAACEGRDGGIHFSAHIEQEPESALSIILDGAADP